MKRLRTDQAHYFRIVPRQWWRVSHWKKANQISKFADSVVQTLFPGARFHVTPTGGPVFNGDELIIPLAGGLHFNVPLMLKILEVDDTPAHRELVREAASELALEMTRIRGQVH